MKKDKVFYQSKFEHYRVMNMWIVIASCISSLFYVISDWYLFGEINMVTVPARTAILIPFAIFMIVNAKVKDYRVIVPLSYLIAHSIMWCTIWACVYLPDLTFASDGFIIIMAIFIFFGFAAPGKWSVIFTGLIFLDIGVANIFLHYPELQQIVLLWLGLVAVHWLQVAVACQPEPRSWAWLVRLDGPSLAWRALRQLVLVFMRIIKTKKLLTSFCLSARMWKY